MAEQLGFDGGSEGFEVDAETRRTNAIAACVLAAAGEAVDPALIDPANPRGSRIRQAGDILVDRGVDFWVEAAANHDSN